MEWFVFSKKLLDMKSLSIFLCVICIYTQPLLSQKAIKSIAFGSCGKQNDSLLIFNTIVQHKPDIFIFLGDNIYGDTENMDTLSYKYNLLAQKSSFQNLQQNCSIIATWDDHDFGKNDGGRHYAMRKESKNIFLNFFKEPASSERRLREGIYTSYPYTFSSKKIQVILLDTRTFRDDLKPYAGEVDHDKRYFYSKDYSPYRTEDSTLLGNEQWKWLEEELKKPADIRIICSSTQFAHEYNTYESWTNFPKEKEKLFSILKNHKVNGVLFLSGDVHYGEISMEKNSALYPMYDITSSGLSSTWHYPCPNSNRIEGPIMENHFGILTFSEEKEDILIKSELYDKQNNQRVEYTIKLSELQFQK